MPDNPLKIVTPINTRPAPGLQRCFNRANEAAPGNILGVICMQIPKETAVLPLNYYLDDAQKNIIDIIRRNLSCQINLLMQLAFFRDISHDRQDLAC